MSQPIRIEEETHILALSATLDRQKPRRFRFECEFDRICVLADIQGLYYRNGRGHLTRLAEGTGGRAFFLRSVDGLSDAYAQIQRDLRSRYLLTYQSSAAGGDGFRSIEVEVADRDLEVRTLRGYFP